MAAKGNKNAVGNKGGGRRAIYNKRFAKLARKLYEFGFTDKEVALEFDVSIRTLDSWKKKYPEFLAVMKKAKPIADANVKQSLYLRATGYSHPDVHISNYQGEITVTPVIKHYPPDTGACIFWLSNRDGENWKRNGAEDGGNDNDIAAAFLKLASVLPD